MRSTPKTVRLVYALLCAGLVVHGVNGITGPGDWPFPEAITVWLYLLLMVIGSLLGVASVVRRRRERLAWTAITAGLVLWTAGDLVWNVWIAKLSEEPYPSVADFLYVGSYIPIYVGVVLLLRARVRPVRGSQWVDGMIGCLAISALAAAALFPAFTGLTEGNATEVAVNLAYPVCDLLVLSFIVLALGLTRWRLDSSWVLLGIGQATNVVADVIYAYQQAAGTYVSGSWLDTVWPLGVAVTAAAAWQRAPRTTVEELGGRTLPLTAAFAAVALGVLLAGQFMHLHLAAALLAGGALILAGVRGGILFRDNLRLLQTSRRESLTDGLSGLPNRRALMLDLEDAAAAATSHEPRTLALFDLDGFKQYNDAFGHAAGDSLLRRLAGDLAAAVDGHGRAYRLGGDEFCILLDRHADANDPVVEAALLALFEPADPYAVDASYGLVALPDDAPTAAEALRLADHRMYALKHGRRATQGQAREVLLALLGEREPDLHRHMRDVAGLARWVG
ncbi:MAG TPA: GGDEF domain-containing protein, partial [Asanoa sp.]